MASQQIVDIKDSSLECMLCGVGRIYIVDNTRDGKEKILNHLWEEHKFKGFVAGIS